MIKMGVFDCIIGNTDRHRGNFLVKDRKVYAIDHGYSFSGSGRTWGNLNSEFVPSSVAEKLERFMNSRESQSALRALLLEILPEEEVADFFSRLAVIASIAKHAKLEDIENVGLRNQI